MIGHQRTLAPCGPDRFSYDLVCEMRVREHNRSHPLDVTPADALGVVLAGLPAALVVLVVYAVVLHYVAARAAA